MQNFSQRLTLLFLSASVALQSISCGWAPEMEYEMLFDREFMFDHTVKNKEYNAWYYNVDLYNESKQGMQNVERWSAYLENAYSPEDLTAFIYREETNFSSPEKELISLRTKRQRPLQSTDKEKKFVDFIVYALKVEKLLKAYEPDPWEEEPRKIVLADFTPLITIALNQVKVNPDEFIKERYAFQLIKLYRYSKQLNHVVEIFNQQFKGRESMLSYWAMEHYAGVLTELGRSYEANYYFAKVYLSCPEKRSSSYLSMKLKSAYDFQRTLEMCTTIEERMALHYIHAMRTKSLALEDLTKITEEIGNHEYARMVMSHEINKLEKILLTRNQEDEEYLSENIKSLRLLKNQVPAYLKQLIALNEKMLAADGDDFYWHLSLAYLYYLDGQHIACSTLLKTFRPTTDLIQKQYDIIYIVNYIETRPFLSDEDENILGSKLFELNEGNPSYPTLTTYSESESTYMYEYNTVNEFIFRKIAERYGETNSFLNMIFSGETFYSLCTDSSTPVDDEHPSDFMLTIADIDKLLADMKRTSETKLTQFAASYYFTRYAYEDDETQKVSTFAQCAVMLNEMKATMLLRNPSTVADAIDLYKSLPSTYLNDCYVHGSPFKFSVKNPNFQVHDEMESSLPKLTRLAFAEKIQQLQAEPLTAANAYLLGLAYYNSSYYGLQWELLAYYRYYDSAQGNVNMNVAENYLKQALSLGGLTKEQQAEVYFMLARCEQNRYTLRNGEFPQEDYYEITFAEYFSTMRSNGYMSNFKQLSTNYRTTKVYQDIIKECNYFTSYLN
jgi:hypothetical protein